jgi:hypothetical protein
VVAGKGVLRGLRVINMPEVGRLRGAGAGLAIFSMFVNVIFFSPLSIMSGGFRELIINHL